MIYVNLLQETLESILWAELPSAAPLSFGPLSLDPNDLPEHVCKGPWASQREVWGSPPPQPLPQRLGHDAKDGIVAANAGSHLLVVFLGVTHLVELGLMEQTGPGSETETPTNHLLLSGPILAWLLTVDASMEPPNQTA